MGKFPNRHLHQKAVYWANPVNDGHGGYSFDDPIEISCRWVNKTQLIAGKDGGQIASQAEVQVEEEMQENEMLLLAELADIDSGDLDDPVAAGARRIVGTLEIPSVKATVFYRKVYL